MTAKFINYKRSTVPPSKSRIGVNLSGMEWNSNSPRNSSIDINYYSNMTVVQPSWFAWLASLGVNKVRIPIAWEFLQPVLTNAGIASVGGVWPYVTSAGQLHTELVNYIQKYLDMCLANGITAVFDIHNYGTYIDFDFQVWGSLLPTTLSKGNRWKAAGSAVTGTAVFTGGSSSVTLNTGNLSVGSPVVFTLGTGGVLPPEISVYNSTNRTTQMATTYYVVSIVDSTHVTVSATAGGTAITPSQSSSGTINRSQPPVLMGNGRTFSNGLLAGSDLADVFTKLVALFGNHAALDGYGLMNEVSINALTEAQWVPIAQVAINAIRAAETAASYSPKKIYVDGPYTNVATSPYTPASFTAITDSANLTFREIHQYLDANRSGAYFYLPYDKIRGFCVDVAGATGYVQWVGSVRGQSSALAAHIYGKPVFTGELGVPYTGPAYMSCAKDLIRQIRQTQGDICLWGSSQNPYFGMANRLVPQARVGGLLLPNPVVSLMKSDAGLEDAKLVTYVDVVANTITIEGYGALVDSVTIGITDSSGGALSASSVTLSPGVLSSASVTFTPPAGASSTFSFTSNRPGTMAAPASVTVLNYTADGSGSATQGKIAMQRTLAEIYLPGNGCSDFGSFAQTWYESVVPSAGLSYRTMAHDQLTGYPNGRIALAVGLNGNLSWSGNKRVAQFEAGSQSDCFINMFAAPDATGNGAAPPHKAWCTNDTFWFGISFDRQSGTTGPLSVYAAVQNKSSSNGVAIIGNSGGTGVTMGCYDNSSTSLTITTPSPTAIAANTAYDAIITFVAGSVTLYINGVQESTAGPFVTGFTTATGGASGQPVLNVASASGWYVGGPVVGTGVPAGTYVKSMAGTAITLGDANLNPVNLTVTASGAYSCGIPLDTHSILGGLINSFKSAPAQRNIRIYGAAFGKGALTASDITGLHAYFASLTASYTSAVPVCTVAPAVTGSQVVGGVLTSTSGTFSGSPTSVVMQWYREGYPISGATATISAGGTTTYTLTSADLGYTISCAAYGINGSGAGRPVLSNEVAQIPDTTTAYLSFESDTVGNAPANITALSGALVVANTGATGMIGQYVRDSTSTSVATAHVYNLNNLQPSGNHSVTWQTNMGSVVGVLAMPQAGTSVSGYTGMLQGYLLYASSAVGVRLYKATSAGLTQLGTTAYPDLTQYAYPFMLKLAVFQGNVVVSISQSGGKGPAVWTQLIAVLDSTYTTANAPLQLLAGFGSVPNLNYVDNISMQT